MNSIFRLKGKIFLFINLAFYIVIFLIGYFIGLKGISFKQLFMENAYAYSSSDIIPSDRYYTNSVNFYLDETEEEYNNHKYGYNNSVNYSIYSNKHDELDSHHVYDYLHEVTQYLVQNYSSNYDFFVTYFSYGSPYQTIYDGWSNNSQLMYRDSIYITWFPKGSIDYYFAFNEDLSIYMNGRTRNSNGYIIGAGFDVLPISIYDSSTGITSFPLDEIHNSTGNWSSIIDFYDYQPYFTYYKDYYQDKYNNAIDSSQQTYYSRLLNDEWYLYPDDSNFFFRFLSLPYSSFDNVYRLTRTNERGWMFYYSSIPIINGNDDIVYVVGSKAYYKFDEIDTYTSSKNIEFEMISSTDLYFESINYRKVCSNSNAVALGRDNINISSFDIFLVETPDIVSHDGIQYRFFDYDPYDSVFTKITPTISQYHYDSGSRNLFNNESVIVGSYINDSGELKSYDGFYVSDYIPILPNNFYTYSNSTISPSMRSKLVFYDSNKDFLSSSDMYLGSSTFSSPNNSYYVRLTLSTNLNTFQLEKGSVATEYESYRVSSNFDSRLDGLSTFNYTFVDNNQLLVDRTNYRNIVFNSGSLSVIHYSSSNTPHGGGSFHVGGENEEQDGFVVGQQNWCFYIPNNIVVSHLNTSLIDNSYVDDVNGEISYYFDGDFHTPDGVVHSSYLPPYTKLNADGSIYSTKNYSFTNYTSDFLKNNTNALSFFGILSNYFFANIDSQFLTFCVVIFALNLVLIIAIYIRGGGKK